jgi:hypothetical protein
MSGVCCTVSAAECAAPCTVSAADDAAFCTEPVALDAMPWVRYVVSWALPMTFSFTRATRPLAAVMRRSTTRAGFTFSLRASTS